jgi:hypothetical protein
MTILAFVFIYAANASKNSKIITGGITGGKFLISEYLLIN